MKESVNWNELQLKDGIYYDDTPYSGKVIGFYDSGQKKYEHSLEMGKNIMDLRLLGMKVGEKSRGYLPRRKG